MLGSFQILDGDQPRRSPDGTSAYWRGVFPRSEAQVVEGSWDGLGFWPGWLCVAPAAAIIARVHLPPPWFRP
jgi:hypothetical protein